MGKMKDPRVGYQTHREKSSSKTDAGTTIEIFDHFDGSIDSTVKVKALKLDFHSGPTGQISPQHIEALLELQKASQHFLIAKHSNDPVMLKKAEDWLERANVRLLEVQ